MCLRPRGKGSVRRAPASRAALGCSAFLQQQQQARSCSAHVFRWAEAFKDSASLLLFPGQTQPGISAVKRTLRVMKVSPSILHPSQVLVQLSRCSCPCWASASAHFPAGSQQLSWGFPLAQPAKGRGAPSLLHSHPLRAVVLADVALEIVSPPSCGKLPPSPLTSVCFRAGEPWLWEVPAKQAAGRAAVGEQFLWFCWLLQKYPAESIPVSWGLFSFFFFPSLSGFSLVQFCFPLGTFLLKLVASSLPGQ